RYHINRFGEGCKLLVFHGLQSPADQDKFFKMMSHAQGARMDEQRCSLQPSRSTPATPKHNGSALNSGRRLDDQRVALPTLPGISGNSERNENGRNAKAGIPVSFTTFKVLVVQT
uniref:Uncharacterized protein n=1 Tax=Cyclopterus lumpus TaxID=8103 RepID=A0A8C3AGQ1_CYCLU